MTVPNLQAFIANVTPNTTGLPGIAALSTIVGALLSIGLIACVAGLVIAAIVWAIGTPARTRTWLAGERQACWWPWSPPS